MKKSTILLTLVTLTLISGSLTYLAYIQTRTPPTQEELTEAAHGLPSERVQAALLSEFSIGETGNIPHNIPFSQLIDTGVERDRIRPINDPTFESVYIADLYLDNEGYGIAVEHEGEHRFYPFQLLVWHELVNDTIGGMPILVTHCPLCASSSVFIARDEGETRVFGTSGWMWNGHPLMYDRTSESLWDQVEGRALIGEKIDRTLELYPSIVSKWDDWKRAYPNGNVLARVTGSTFDYTRSPYGDYLEDRALWYPVEHHDGRLEAKTPVYGIATENHSTAYLLDTLNEQNVVNDDVGQQTILLLLDEAIGTVRAFDRRVHGQALTFERKDGSVIDKETGSVWNLEGTAVDGELAGQSLTRIPHQKSFWFSWVATHPETDIYSL